MLPQRLHQDAHVTFPNQFDDNPIPQPLCPDDTWSGHISHHKSDHASSHTHTLSDTQRHSLLWTKATNLISSEYDLISQLYYKSYCKYCDHIVPALAGTLTLEQLWPLATTKYSSLQPRIGVYVSFWNFPAFGRNNLGRPPAAKVRFRFVQWSGKL